MKECKLNTPKGEVICNQTLRNTSCTNQILLQSSLDSLIRQKSIEFEKKHFKKIKPWHHVLWAIDFHRLFTDQRIVCRFFRKRYMQMVERHNVALMMPFSRTRPISGTCCWHTAYMRSASKGNRDFSFSYFFHFHARVFFI